MKGFAHHHSVQAADVGSGCESADATSYGRCGGTKVPYCSQSRLCFVPTSKALHAPCFCRERHHLMFIPPGWARASSSSRMPSYTSSPAPRLCTLSFPTGDHHVPSPRRDQKLPKGRLHASDFFPIYKIPHLPQSSLLESWGIKPDLSSSTSFATWCWVT